jgi:hypothetical protein
MISPGLELRLTIDSGVSSPFHSCLPVVDTRSERLGEENTRDASLSLVLINRRLHVINLDSEPCIISFRPTCSRSAF